jgi:hypothetical protein
MADEYNVPTIEDLERFRNELVEELKLTREEVRQAFQEAAEPFRKDLPLILEQLAKLEERVSRLEARQFEQWPKPPVC